MAEVIVTIKNKAGRFVSITLDDETDAERIAYLKKGVNRGDYERVDVKTRGAR